MTSPPKTLRSRGFALVVTLSLMILLTVIAVGLLTLSSVSLRTASQGQAMASARANARLALMLALGDLQKTCGDDRRITANGSILSGAKQPQVTGVWHSGSPKYSKNPTRLAFDYSKKNTLENAAESDSIDRTGYFVRWLVSGQESDLTNPAWVTSAPPTTNQVTLFQPGSDGFSLQATKIMVTGNAGIGAMAWAVSQEATKAKITVTGPEVGQRVANDDLQAQPRPSLALNSFFNQPPDGWNPRAARVLDFNQTKLDGSLWKGTNSTAGGADFTTQGAGLLTNAVDGGLKTDMSLGFEMADPDFLMPQWTSLGKTFNNPFKSGAETSFTTPAPYQGQRPLYKPQGIGGAVAVPVNYNNNFIVQFSFPLYAAPTFDSLRSFYRIPHHLYNTADGPTVFERPNDHVAGAADYVTGSVLPLPTTNPVTRPPAYATLPGAATQLGIRPVLDRCMFLLSGGLSASDKFRLIITPIITLWNPYNTPLDIEGSVAYFWVDEPIGINIKTNPTGDPDPSHVVDRGGGWVGGMLVSNSSPVDRTAPYFCASITADGNPLGSGTPTPIHFEPGEVRVFAPAKAVPTEAVPSPLPPHPGTLQQPTLWLRPVNGISQFSTQGGLSIPVGSYVLKSIESAQFTFNAGAPNWRFYISLEDATRAKSATANTVPGQVVTDIVTNDGLGVATTSYYPTAQLPYAALKQTPGPICVWEAYHKVAQAGGSAQAADLVFTGNPRQPWMNSLISNTTNTPPPGQPRPPGPQYQVRTRGVADFDGVLQSANGGRDAYYGATQSPSGRTHLSFFEIPSAPLLSLADFQHADLTQTPFSPANQVGNSWASAYVARQKVATTFTVPASSGAAAHNVPLADVSYLCNESLWDGWFFSGAAPTLTYSNSAGSANVWLAETATTSRDIPTILTDFLNDPLGHPLRNPRMIPAGPSNDKSALVSSLTEPAGCLKMAAALMVDGAFNVNSTSVEAWTAVLAGLRGATFNVAGSPAGGGSDTAFPRFRDPVGTPNDNWHGFRTLTDAQIKTLAQKIVDQVILRGPFLSMGEFVNRRVSSDALGLKGALQTAIDDANLNSASVQSPIDVTIYQADTANSTIRSNIVPADTGVGIPGYLTQADVLKSLAPVLTVRSDTFTIRTYGEARDAAGNITATARAEATVQRVPDFLDAADPAYTPVASLSASANQKFGRRFQVVSFRYLPAGEILP